MMTTRIQTLREGISLATFDRLTKLGTRMDGKRVRVGSRENGIGGIVCHVWQIQLPTQLCDGLVLVSGLHEADSRTDTSGCGYTRGGAAYCAAVDVAKELASALGFPTSF